MENLDAKGARGGRELMNYSTTRSSGHSVTVPGSNANLSSAAAAAAAAARNVFETCLLPFDLFDLNHTWNRTTGERRNNVNVEYYSSSAYDTAGNTNFCCKSVLSRTYSRKPREAVPIDHVAERSNVAGFRKQKVFDYGSHSSQAGPAAKKLKLIENIADTLSPAEVTHLLFQGHKNEHTPYLFFNPSIGSNVSSTRSHQNDVNVVGDHQLPPSSQPFDLRTRCLYCWEAISNENPMVSKRSCGHYFHINCFPLRPETTRGQHLRAMNCEFCLLEMHNEDK